MYTYTYTYTYLYDQLTELNHTIYLYTVVFNVLTLIAWQPSIIFTSVTLSYRSRAPFPSSSAQRLLLLLTLTWPGSLTPRKISRVIRAPSTYTYTFQPTLFLSLLLH